MVEVWRALDTSLDRSVALKILSSSMAGDANLRLRMEREAKVISQLSHPHICTLFDVGDGYLVRELLDGETPADRICTRTSSGHRGVAAGRADRAGAGCGAPARHHSRDLKPANIMVTRSGVKLLDLGLARSKPAAIGSDAETEQRSITEEGAVVGTLQYMAPEQLDGLNADARITARTPARLQARRSRAGERRAGALTRAAPWPSRTARRRGRRCPWGASRTSVISAIASSDPAPTSQVQPLAPARLEQLASSGRLAGHPRT